MAEPGEIDITGRQRQVRHRPLQLAACALVFALGVGYEVRSGRWFFLVYSLYGVHALIVSWRPPTQVTAAGVRRPWRRPGFVPWSDVSAVVAPHPGMGGMRLQLTTGQQVVIDDIPAARAAAVAAIGGREVIRPALPSLPPARPHPPRPRTDADVLSDVNRQAVALAQQREELAALSRRLRP